MESLRICLLNDSFPPQFDGVANATANYAKELHRAGHRPVVVTPSHPRAEDGGRPYPVLRYPSVAFHKLEGYMAGIPFSPEVASRLSEEGAALLHSHCPVMSTIMARQLRQILDAPLILTYHTKFDIDIANLTPIRQIQKGGKRALVENVSACDEVWVVSRGAGENLRSLGYEGNYIVMPNGVDLPRGRVSGESAARATAGCSLPHNVPVYLFVGRMMWYKGIRIILDGLARLKRAGRDFRMVFVGSGNDRAEIEAHAAQCGLGDRCVFTGAVLDREALRAWYCRADLFLFPSTFDTNGLVVGEAAACSLPSVLIRGSCAAERAVHGHNSFLIEESAQSLCACLDSLYGQTEALRRAGQAASRELYMSWEEAVAAAMDRYPAVIDRYRSGACPARRKPIEGLLKANGELMEALSNLPGLRRGQPERRQGGA